MKAMWKGAISFGLVLIPCALHKATEAEPARFHQAHKADGGGISLKRVCKLCATEVPYAEVGKAMEMPDKTLVLLSDEEIEALDDARGEEGQRADVLHFTDPATIDPVAFGDSYYVSPLPGGENAYALLREAMRETGLVGLCSFRMNSASKEKLAVIRLRDQVLILTTLKYDEEVREPDFKFLGETPEVKSSEVKLAKGLIVAMASDYDPAQHQDAYRAAVSELAQAKVSGTAPAPKPAAKKVSGSSLANALQASVIAARKSKKAS
jgi:DNA end-binding protein Ku